MIPPTRLAETRLLIVGLGLMGGSLALALQGRCASLLACDPSREALEQALKQGWVEKASTQLVEVLPEADLIVLAAPVDQILSILHILPSLRSEPVVILDLGSTKRQIAIALEALPKPFEAIGGHPMCGKERTGLANAEPDLYRGKVFALTPLENTTPRAQYLAEQTVQAVGANPLLLDPQTHDHWTAATSHLPFLVASALALATPPEVAPMIGTGFRSTARIAATPAEVMLPVLASNSDEVLAALHQLQHTLTQLETLLLAQNNPGLAALLSQAVARHALLTASTPPEKSS